MTPTPGEITEIRPRADVLRRIGIGVVAGIALELAIGLASGDSPVLLLLALALAILVGGLIAALRFRNERLTVQGWDIAHTDWRGRTTVIPRQDISGAVLVDVGTRDRPRRRLIITRVSTAPPFLASATLWHLDDLRRLTAALGIPLFTPPEQVSVRKLQARIPTLRLPYWERHPLVLAFAAFAVLFVVLVALFALGVLD